MDNSRPPVVVLSRNYSTGLGVIRSLGMAGYTVDMVASTKKKGSSIIVSCSKYVRNSVEVVTPNIQGDSGSGLIEALMEYTKLYKEKIVLFPTDDFTASVVAVNHDVLKEHFLMPGIIGESGNSLIDIMDKTTQGNIARKVGLLTPLEWVIPLNNQIIVPKEVVYPCFVKPVQSISGHKTEMSICRDEVELSQHLRKMKDNFSNRRVLVQEYLNISKEYDLSGVCLDQEIIIPGIIEKTRIAKHELGVTMSGKMVSPDVLGELKNKIIELLKQFHYVGMFDMELHLCGDKVYFNEVNLRSGGPNYAYFLNGANLPAIFVKHITGEEFTPNEAEIQHFGKTFVYEKVAWEDYIHSYMTKQELRQCISEADFTLLANDEDPKPGKCFYKRIRLSALKHWIISTFDRQKSNEASRNAFSKVKPLVVVAGRNYGNILTMTRDLGHAGYDVEVLRVFKTNPNPFNLLGRMKPDAFSKYVRKFHECVANHDSAKIIQDLIEMAGPNEKQLLIPVDDYTVCVVDDNLDRLSEYYIIPSVAGQRGEITRLMDKNEQKRLAVEFDLPMLHSVLIKGENGKFKIPEEVQYPCFIKPNVSMKSTKSKMARCENKEELSQALTRLAKSEDFEMLVEKFADIKTEYSILGLCTEEGAIAPGLLKAIEGGHKERKGVALTGQIVPIAGFHQIIDKCNKFIQSLKYTGLFDVDLIEARDGKLYFVELNFRAGASTHAVTQVGVNLPAMLADYLVKGRSPDKECKIETTGKRFVSEKVLIEEYARSDVNLSKAKGVMSDADIYFVKDQEDPKPYSHFKKYVFVASLMRIPYRIRDNRKKNS